MKLYARKGSRAQLYPNKNRGYLADQNPGLYDASVRKEIPPFSRSGRKSKRLVRIIQKCANYSCFTSALVIFMGVPFSKTSVT